jgi:hypothetical protein
MFLSSCQCLSAQPLKLPPCSHRQHHHRIDHIARSSLMMPRSVADATRFTATVPHAHSKSSHIPSTSPTAPSPTNRPRETPQQRVTRLRAAALKAKAGKISTADKIIVRGRIWADRAHRFVTLSLVGLTGLCTFLFPSSAFSIRKPTYS